MVSWSQFWGAREGAKWVGRPAGNNGFWGDSRCQGRYTFGELERENFQIVGAATLKLRAPNKVQTYGMERKLVYDNLRERVEWWACGVKVHKQVERNGECGNNAILTLALPCHQQIPTWAISGISRHRICSLINDNDWQVVRYDFFYSELRSRCNLCRVISH